MKNLAEKQTIPSIRQIQTTTGSRNGIRTIVSRGKLPLLRVGIWVKVRLVLGLGGNQTIAHEKKWPRLGLEFRLGLILGLGGNFPRGHLS